MYGVPVQLASENQTEAPKSLPRVTFGYPFAAKPSDISYVLVDCPPALGLLTVNAMAAADAVLVPLQCEYYALEGLSDLVQTIKKVRAHLNPQLQIEGLLRTMFDPRNTLAQQVSAQLQQHFGDKLYRTVIPRNVRLGEAPSHGLPAILYDARSRGAEAYVALAHEFLSRHRPVDANQTRHASRKED